MRGHETGDPEIRLITTKPCDRPGKQDSTDLIYGFASGCFLAALTWLVGAVWRAREEARSAQCAGNLAQLGLALHNYDLAYGSLRPLFVVESHQESPFIAGRYDGFTCE